ncbi:MAG: hypothetical protein R2685_10685 [Candidatus Nitrosocosmicus sp.]|nr:hypothetical protein [Candidatus Nitrosocosmicus sp.]
MPSDFRNVKLIMPSSRLNPQTYFYAGYIDPRMTMNDTLADSIVHKINDTFAFEQGNSNGKVDFHTSSKYNPAQIKPADHSRFLAQACMQDNQDFKNIEASVYVTFNSASSGSKVLWRVRTGKDRNKAGDCESCGYEGELNVNGQTRFIKRQYTGASFYKPYQVSTSDIENRTVGFKFIVYNKNGAVNLEIHLDENNNNYWVKKHIISDTHDWGNNGTYCKGFTKDQQISFGGPIVSLLWKADDVSEAVDFTKLSIREIDPEGKFLRQ